MTQLARNTRILFAILPAGLDIVGPGAAVQRSLSGVVEGVDLGAVLQQHLDHVVVRLVGRQVERRQQVLEAFRVKI